MITVIRVCRKCRAAGPWRYGSLNSPLLLVRFVHGASRIVTANRSLTAAEALTWGYKTS